MLLSLDKLVVDVAGPTNCAHTSLSHLLLGHIFRLLFRVRSHVMGRAIAKATSMIGLALESGTCGIALCCSRNTLPMNWTILLRKVFGVRLNELATDVHVSTASSLIACIIHITVLVHGIT